jgi:hypothetical protein
LFDALEDQFVRPNNVTEGGRCGERLRGEPGTNGGLYLCERPLLAADPIRTGSHIEGNVAYTKNLVATASLGWGLKSLHEQKITVGGLCEQWSDGSSRWAERYVVVIYS